MSSDGPGDGNRADHAGHEDPGKDLAPTHEFEITAGDAGQRLDHFLVSQALPFTRSQLKKLIDEGHCTVSGRVGRPAQKLRAAEQVCLAPPPVRPFDRVAAEAIPLKVLYEDDDLIVVDKAAGMVVHPAPGHQEGTLVGALLGHCKTLSGVGGEERPGIVHRLDRLTSGVLVASKTDRAHEGLARQFRQHSIERRYRAIVCGELRPPRGLFDTLHGRHPVDRKRYSSRVTRGRRAVTHYETLEPLFGATLVEARLETGRTHQVRVHFADHGNPLLGDPVYGGRQRVPGLQEVARALGRQALHAYLLAFEHPRSGERIQCTASLPTDMLIAVEGLRALRDERRT